MRHIIVVAVLATTFVAPASAEAATPCTYIPGSDPLSSERAAQIPDQFRGTVVIPERSVLSTNSRSNPDKFVEVCTARRELLVFDTRDVVVIDGVPTVRVGNLHGCGNDARLAKPLALSAEQPELTEAEFNRLFGQFMPQVYERVGDLREGGVWYLDPFSVAPYITDDAVCPEVGNDRDAKRPGVQQYSERAALQAAGQGKREREAAIGMADVSFFEYLVALGESPYVAGSELRLDDGIEYDTADKAGIGLRYDAYWSTEDYRYKLVLNWPGACEEEKPPAATAAIGLGVHALGAGDHVVAGLYARFGGTFDPAGRAGLEGAVLVGADISPADRATGFGAVAGVGPVVTAIDGGKVDFQLAGHIDLAGGGNPVGGWMAIGGDLEARVLADIGSRGAAFEAGLGPSVWGGLIRCPTTMVGGQLHLTVRLPNGR